MKDDTRKLESEITDLAVKLKQKQNQLEGIRRTCRHQWGQIVYDPIHREGYMIPGDPPGTMGIDRRSDFYVPPETTKRWRRTCSECGESQTTSSTKKVAKCGTIPGTTAEVEEPVF